MKTVSIALLIFLSAIGCKTAGSKKMVMLEANPEVQIAFHSACRESSLSPLKNEEAMKEMLSAHSATARKKLKLRSAKLEEKSTFKTTGIELTIYESCLERSDNTTPALRLHEKLSLEHIKTRKIYVFEMDSVVHNQSLKPKQLVRPQADIEACLLPLTTELYKKAKNFFADKSK